MADDVDLVICAANNWFPIRTERRRAREIAEQIHDEWYAGKQSFIFRNPDGGIDTFINLKALVGVYIREIVNTSERQVKALEKIANAAAEGDQWKKGDDE